MYLHYKSTDLMSFLLIVQRLIADNDIKLKLKDQSSWIKLSLGDYMQYTCNDVKICERIKNGTFCRYGPCCCFRHNDSNTYESNIDESILRDIYNIYINNNFIPLFSNKNIRVLQANIKLLDTNINNVQNIHDDLKDMIDTLKKKNKNLMKNISSSEDRILNLREQESSIQQENVILKEQKLSLEEENLILKEQNSSLQQENVTLREQKLSLEEENLILKEQNSHCLEKIRTLETKKRKQDEIVETNTFVMSLRSGNKK